MASGLERRLDQSFLDAAVISINDTVGIARPCDAIYVSTAGALAIKTWGNTQITFPSVGVGVFKVGATYALSTGTTATGLIALYTSIA